MEALRADEVWEQTKLDKFANLIAVLASSWKSLEQLGLLRYECSEAMVSPYTSCVRGNGAAKEGNDKLWPSNHRICP